MGTPIAQPFLDSKSPADKDDIILCICVCIYIYIFRFRPQLSPLQILCERETGTIFPR